MNRMYHKYVDHGFVEYYGLQGFAIPLATVVITRHNILEVESWCDDKCLPPRAKSCGFKSGNQPLQKQLGLRLPTIISHRPHKSGELCKLGRESIADPKFWN